MPDHSRSDRPAEQKRTRVRVKKSKSDYSKTSTSESSALLGVKPSLETIMSGCTFYSTGKPILQSLSICSLTRLSKTSTSLRFLCYNELFSRGSEEALDAQYELMLGWFANLSRIKQKENCLQWLYLFKSIEENSRDNARVHHLVFVAIIILDDSIKNDELYKKLTLLQLSYPDSFNTATAMISRSRGLTMLADSMQDLLILKCESDYFPILVNCRSYSLSQYKLNRDYIPIIEILMEIGIMVEDKSFKQEIINRLINFLGDKGRESKTREIRYISCVAIDTLITQLHIDKNTNVVRILGALSKLFPDYKNTDLMNSMMDILIDHHVNHSYDKALPDIDDYSSLRHEDNEEERDESYDPSSSELGDGLELTLSEYQATVLIGYLKTERNAESAYHQAEMCLENFDEFPEKLLPKLARAVIQRANRFEKVEDEIYSNSELVIVDDEKNCKYCTHYNSLYSTLIFLIFFELHKKSSPNSKLMREIMEVLTSFIACCDEWPMEINYLLKTQEVVRNRLDDAFRLLGSIDSISHKVLTKITSVLLGSDHLGERNTCLKLLSPLLNGMRNYGMHNSRTKYSILLDLLSYLSEHFDDSINTNDRNNHREAMEKAMNIFISHAEFIENWRITNNVLNQFMELAVIHRDRVVCDMARQSIYKFLQWRYVNSLREIITDLLEHTEEPIIAPYDIQGKQNFVKMVCQSKVNEHNLGLIGYKLSLLISTIRANYEYSSKLNVHLSSLSNSLTHVLNALDENKSIDEIYADYINKMTDIQKSKQYSSSSGALFLRQGTKKESNEQRIFALINEKIKNFMVRVVTLQANEQVEQQANSTNAPQST